MQSQKIDQFHCHELQTAIVTGLQQDEVRKEGRFLLLEWLSEEAFFTAQGLYLHTPGENKDDAFWNKYYGYCKNVQIAPNMGITAGLHQFLKAAADISPALIFGGPASVNSSSNKTFLGVSNGAVAVAATDTDLSGTTKAYKGVDTGFPTEGLVGGKATLTWQCTYGTAEAQFAWTEGGIFATTGSVPNAGQGSTGVTALPASTTALAIALWTPSPLTKGAAIISQAYQVGLA